MLSDNPPCPNCVIGHPHHFLILIHVAQPPRLCAYLHRRGRLCYIINSLPLPV